MLSRIVPLAMTSSELQRVDRCTAAHGIEARVPFLDLDFVACCMKFCATDKMSHASLGRIQKYILRHAFDTSSENLFAILPILSDDVLYREKEQFADGIGKGWIAHVQKYAVNSEGILDGAMAESTLYKRIFYETKQNSFLQAVSTKLHMSRQERRRKSSQKNIICHKLEHISSDKGKLLPCRWLSVSSDFHLNNLLTKSDACCFVTQVLGWNAYDAAKISPTLETLNRIITSMLERVPFHNLTLLTRPRRPPTLDEIKSDMMLGLGGPCSVVNSFLASLLIALGFGPNVFLLSCQILDRVGCHVAILVQIKGLRYFVDVGNGKPYNEAVPLGDQSIKTSQNGVFQWNLTFNPSTKRMELIHHTKSKYGVGLSFDPSETVRFQSFRAMIIRSRSDTSFGPFLTGLRLNCYPLGTSQVAAIRDVTLYEGSLDCKRVVKTRAQIQEFAKKYFNSSVQDLLSEALDVLEKQNPTWLVDAIEKANVI